MFNKIWILFFLLFCLSLQAQEEMDIRQIINQRDLSYAEIVSQADLYFAEKYPNKTGMELSMGDYRDGDFVKYQRWKAFWGVRLDRKGKLADIVGYKRKAIAQKSQTQRSSGSLGAVTWDNSISHTDYIVSQIGMGRTTTIAFHPTNPNIFYVGAAVGGIWKTTDGGNSYVPIGDNLPHLSVSSIILDPNNPTTIYAAVSDHLWYGHYGIGVYVSYDDGASWSPTALDYPLSDLVRIYDMEMDPNNPLSMIAASDLGLLKTTDGWASYTTVSNVPSHDIHYLEGSSMIVVAGGLNGEVLRSTDGGNSFTVINDLGNGYVRIATTPLDANRLVATVSNSLYTSTDGGLSYNFTSTLPEANMVVEFSQLDINTLMTGNFEVFLSNNGGNNFSQIADWLGAGLQGIHVDQRNLFVNPLEPNFIYLANDGGIYRYNLNNGIFENLSDGLIITQFYDIAVSQTNPEVVSGGSQDNGSLYRNSAGTWVEHAPTGDGMVTEIDYKDHNIIYYEYQFGAVYRNEIGGGETFISPTNDNGDWETPYKIDPINPERLVIGYRSVYESLDRGNTWTNISGPLSGNNLNEIAIAKSNTERIYATQGANFYVKNTFNDNWSQRATPTNNPITDLEVDPCDEDKVYISVGGYTGGDKVYMSSDAGVSWVNITDNLPNVLAASIEMYEPASGGIFVGTDTGVFYRDDSFSTWQELGQLPNSTVEDIEIQCVEDLIRVGTFGRSIWEADLSCIVKTAPDADSDGVRDCCDICPNFDDKLCGTPCDDGNPGTTNETWQEDCTCQGEIQQYCDATGSAGTGADWISRVTLNDLDMPSAQSGYSDFTTSSADLAGKSSYPITVVLNNAFPEDAVYVWIDYNQDQIFDESERTLMTSSNGSTTFTGTVVTPCIDEFYSTRMRVRAIYGNPNTPQPCGSLFGEVEDYTINFTDIRNCTQIIISR